ncbi:MAG: hypothetical protein WCI04_03945 [archaeon]
MQEIERIFLAKQFIGGLKTCQSKEIIDIYLAKFNYNKIFLK